MPTTADFLVELLTEELPPKSLLTLAQAFEQQLIVQLQKAQLTFTATQFYATPRRLAVLVKELVAEQPEQIQERKGPTLAAAFTANGDPSPACLGFARSCGVTPQQLLTVKNAQGEWLVFRETIPGQPVQTLLPTLVNQVVRTLPIAKRMRWGESQEEFARPVHAVILLYGDAVIPAEILGCQTGRRTRGHRFHAPQWLDIPRASEYANVLKTQGKVLADFAERKQTIITAANACLAQLGQADSRVLFSEALLNEVTGLVEWPVALCGHFDPSFLQVPEEVLISAMQDHQRYFPLLTHEGKLLPAFITIANLVSKDPARVIHGNERVLRARLADAAFFYTTDQQQPLSARVAALKGIIFQAPLGTLYDKSLRMQHLATFLATHLQADPTQAARAALLAKADLTSQMVGEFPELQGVMGYYYAKQAGEPLAVALAIKEHYYPRFSGDQLPSQLLGQIIALADRVDTLVGTFGIKQIPTGDKDPYGLRRATLGLIRIVIEKKINLDLRELFVYASNQYHTLLTNPDTIPSLLTFVQERLRGWYQERGVSNDVFAAVAALNLTNLLDIDTRIQAVQTFKKLTAAETLSIANKRVSNILAKYPAVIKATAINPQYLELAAEQVLARELEEKQQLITRLYQAGQYEQVLLTLAELRKPVDDFFDEVMVMTEDTSRRENRLLLLKQLRELFLQVADIALLETRSSIS